MLDEAMLESEDPMLKRKCMRLDEPSETQREARREARSE